MDGLIEFISKPWPWYVAGPLIALVMIYLMLIGKKFGVSSNLETLCTIAGAGNSIDYFKTNWKSRGWNLLFIVGSVIGGFIAQNFLTTDSEILISASTKTDLIAIGINAPGRGIVPEEIFNWNSVFTLRGFIVLVIGGFFVGFGTRYAGGCTSGHAISGLSNLQIPSLIAVIGFFIGGLFATYFLIPLIFNL